MVEFAILGVITLGEVLEHFHLTSLRKERSIISVEGLRSGTKTLPWQKHPSVLDRVTLRVALSSFGLLLQSIANWDDRIEVCIRFPAAAFKHRFIVHQYPVAIHSLVGIADQY